MEVWRQYGAQTDLYFVMLKASYQDFAATGDWTPATGDTKISKDGGNVANTTNNPVPVGGTGSVLWKLTLTESEMQAAVIAVQIVDSATKAVEDQLLLLYTHGHAAAAASAVWDEDHVAHMRPGTFGGQLDMPTSKIPGAEKQRRGD